MTHHLNGRAASFALMAALVGACGGDTKTDDEDTDVALDTIDTSATVESFFEPDSFAYFIQWGVDANGNNADFVFDGNTFSTGLFVNMFDRRDNECTFGYLIEGPMQLTQRPPPDSGDTGDSGTGDSGDGGNGGTGDAELDAWLSENGLFGGFAIRPGEYTVAEPDCEFDPNTPLGQDPQAAFLLDAEGNPTPIFIGVDDELGPSFDELLDEVQDLDPGKNFWTGGFMRLPFDIVTTDPDTMEQTTSNLFEVAFNGAAVDADMEIQEDGQSFEYLNRGNIVSNGEVQTSVLFGQTLLVGFQ